MVMVAINTKSATTLKENTIHLNSILFSDLQIFQFGRVLWKTSRKFIVNYKQYYPDNMYF